MNAEREMDHADGLGADEDARDAQLAAGTDPMSIEVSSIEARRGELAETGWPAAHMSDEQVVLAHEAEGDRNHERVSGERRVWEHEMPLSDEARALIAACVASGDEINDPETLTAPPETWEEVRGAFPLSLYYDSRIIEGGIS